MDFDTDRRRFLEFAGTGTALSLAGCSGLQSHSGDGSQSTADGGSSNDAVAAVAVQVDQQELQRRQGEIRSEVEAGNVSATEAQQRARALQTELRSKAAASFTRRVESDSALTITDSVEQFGLLLLSGPATALIESLSFEETGALLPEATFRQAKSQATQQSETSTSSR